MKINRETTPKWSQEASRGSPHTILLEHCQFQNPQKRILNSKESSTTGPTRKRCTLRQSPTRNQLPRQPSQGDATINTEFLIFFNGFLIQTNRPNFLLLHKITLLSFVGLAYGFCHSLVVQIVVLR